MKTLFATMVACSVVAPMTFAATNPQDQSSSTQGDQAGRYAAGNLDYQIAACLLLGNQEEIALAQLGEQHATHPQVKELAKMLVDHHSKAVEAITKAAPEIANLQLATTAAKQAPAATVAAGEDRSIEMIQRIKGECLSLTQKELEQHQGAEFDKAFVGQQIGAHLGMLAQLRGSKSFASPELQKVIAEGEKMTTTHMAEAKKIMGQIKDETNKTADASQRSAAPKR